MREKEREKERERESMSLHLGDATILDGIHDIIFRHATDLSQDHNHLDLVNVLSRDICQKKKITNKYDRRVADLKAEDVIGECTARKRVTTNCNAFKHT
jgi:hypothetical protein